MSPHDPHAELPAASPAAAAADGLLDGGEAPAPGVAVVMEPETQAVAPGVFRKLGLATLVTVVGIAATWVVPALQWARPWKPGDPVPFWNLLGRGRDGDAVAQAQATAAVAQAEELARVVAAAEEDATPAPEPVVVRPAADMLPPYVAKEGDLAEPTRAVEDPSGHALDRFFLALARTEAGFAGAVTRVAHWGDSAIGNDGIPGAIRRRMQRRFGDAGHGFHLLQPPNLSYRHQNVRFETDGTWGLCFIIQLCSSDGHYGLGGVTFRSTGGAQSVFATAKDDSPTGRAVSSFEVWYAAQPGGGRLQLRVDRGEPRVVDTRAEALEDRWERISVPDGPHELEVRAAGGGKVRAYGVVMERAGPGVVWDELSLIGAFSSRLGAMDEAHFQRQLGHRGTDLVVLMFGGNDMVREVSMEQYKSDYRPVLQRVRGGPKPPSCLVMAPLDHGERDGPRIVSRAIVAPMVQAQRELAFEAGCAFFDTYAAMGGEGSMGRWFHANPRLGSGDLSHLTAKGHLVVGEYVYGALLYAWAQWRREWRSE